MGCRTCNILLAAYRSSVSLFRNAVRKGSGAVGDDPRLTGAKVERLGQQCRDASDAFMAHWRRGHGSTVENSAASSGTTS